jgi:hypothetical protein
VAGAATAISGLNPKFLTIHASGGRAMVSAAAKAVPNVSVTAVTILTSLSESDLFEIGYSNPALESAVAGFGMVQILFYKTRLSCDIFRQSTKKMFCVKQNLLNSQKWANPLTAV